MERDSSVAPGGRGFQPSRNTRRQGLRVQLPAGNVGLVSGEGVEVNSTRRGLSASQQGYLFVYAGHEINVFGPDGTPLYGIAAQLPWGRRVRQSAAGTMIPPSYATTL